MPEKHFTTNVLTLLRLSQDKCMFFSHPEVLPQHFLLSALDLVDDLSGGTFVTILRKFDIDFAKLEGDILDSLKGVESVENYPEDQESIPKSKDLQKVLKRAKGFADEWQHSKIQSECVLAAMAVLDIKVKYILAKYDINVRRLKSVLKDTVANTGNKPNPNKNNLVHASGSSQRSQQPQFKNSSNLLSAYGKNLTELVKEKGRIKPVIGRDNEINRVIHVLCRMTKNNPIIVGESGVGKTAIVEGLARRIVENRVPNEIKNKKIISLELGTLVAGTKYRGQLEERIVGIIAEVEKDPNIILVVDEAHTLVGAGGGEGSLDAANLIKEPLSSGRIKCIAITTHREYSKHIEPDAALMRRFNPINIKPPTDLETIEILEGISEDYEEYHKVRFEDDVFRYIVKITERYMPNRFFPDKAIDVLDEVSSRKKLEVIPPNESVQKLRRQEEKIESQLKKELDRQDIDACRAQREKLDEIQIKIREEEDKILENIDDDRKTITKADVASAVSSMTQIPIAREDEFETMKTLESKMLKYIKGQGKAVSLACQAIVKGKLGLKDPRKPIAVLLFAGPTGVGKTEIARKLAKVLFGDEKSLVREDMSSFSEGYSVSKLVGCFLPDMRVKTKSKGLVPIKDIEIGDEVLTHKNRFRKVLKKHVYDEYDGLIKCVHFNDGSRIDCTPDHEFFAMKVDDFEPEWVHARNLTKYDTLLRPKAFEDKIISSSLSAAVMFLIKYAPVIVNLSKTVYNIWNDYKKYKYKRSNYKLYGVDSVLDDIYSGSVYDLTVEEDESYTIEGVAVHNSAPGYISSSDGGSLTNKIKKQPYSVVLFDEIEKAHESIWDLLLPILEEGRIEESKSGTEVDFKNCVIIMSTNVGSKIGDMSQIGVRHQGESGENAEYESLKKRTLKKLRTTMQPEFINRIDEVVVLGSLNKEVVRDILDNVVEDRNEYYYDLHKFKIELSDDLKDKIVNEGFDEKYGARELKRCFERIVINPLSPYYMNNKSKVSGDDTTILCKLNKNGETVFSIKK